MRNRASRRRVHLSCHCAVMGNGGYRCHRSECKMAVFCGVPARRSGMTFPPVFRGMVPYIVCRAEMGLSCLTGTLAIRILAVMFEIVVRPLAASGIEMKSIPALMSSSPASRHSPTRCPAAGRTMLLPRNTALSRRGTDSHLEASLERCLT